MNKTAPILLLLTLLSAPLVGFADIGVEEGYVRATPPGVKATAAYMTLRNNSDKTRTLVGADSDLSRNTEIHTLNVKSGVVMMQRVKSLAVPAHSEITLEPGGYHLMLINLNKAAVPGEAVSLTLKFADGNNEIIVLPIEAPHQNHDPDKPTEGHSQGVSKH